MARLASRLMWAGLLLLILAAPATAAPGDLDTVFDGDGLGTLDFGPDDTAQAVAVQPDGKIVVAGFMDGGNGNFGVARFLPSGAPDPDFSFDGHTNITFGAVDEAKDVAIQPDGKIVVAGYTTANPPADMAVLRLTAGGEPDNSFDTDGQQTVDLGFDDRANGVVIEPDGDILLAGQADGGSSDFGFARLTETGAPELSFGGGDGEANYSMGGADFATDVALGPSGRIYAVGYSSAGGNNDFGIMRLLSNGTQDMAFSTDAEDLVQFGDDDRAQAVVVQPDGKPVVAGGWDGGQADYALLRYETDGDLDPTFSGNGMQNLTFDPSTEFGGAEFAHALALTELGQLVVGGFTDTGANPDNFGVAVFESNGELDPSFSGDGRRIVDFGTDDEAFGLGLFGDSAYVAGSTVQQGAPLRDFAVAALDISPRSFNASDATAAEAAGSLVVTVRLSGPSTLPSSVAYETSGGSATAGSDYTATAGVLDFAAGVTERTISIPLANDGTVERDESVGVKLSDPVNGVLGESLAIATIENDDAAASPPPPPPPVAPPPPPPVDTRAPTVSRARVTPARVGLRKRGRLTFSLSEAAKVAGAVQRCARFRGRRCSAFKSAGRLSINGKSGANSLSFRRRLGGRKLAVGTYRITLTPTDAAGNKGRAVRVTFRVVR